MSTRKTGKDTNEQTRPLLSTGIPCLPMSVVVDPTLAFPSQLLLVSLKIFCCLSVFLSTFLSAYTA